MGPKGQSRGKGRKPGHTSLGAASSCSCLGRQRGDAPAKQPACQPSTDGGADFAVGEFTPAANVTIQDTGALDPCCRTLNSHPAQLGPQWGQSPQPQPTLAPSGGWEPRRQRGGLQARRQRHDAPATRRLSSRRPLTTRQRAGFAALLAPPPRYGQWVVRGDRAPRRDAAPGEAPHDRSFSLLQRLLLK